MALDNASLTVRAGSVHAFVGANGAGKSTALGIVAGRISPTTGGVRVFGEEQRSGDARAARSSGVATIYQELTIVPTLSTQANVFLGQELRGTGLVRERAMRRAFKELNDRLGVRIPPDVLARDLSVGQQQMVEIMRALVRIPRLILFDEPTAALARRERDAFFRAVREMNQQGVTVVLVSHQLDDVLSVCDAITVFRDGRVIESRARATWKKDDLIHAIVGREIPPHAPVSASSRAEKSRLRVEGLEVGAVRAASFAVAPGEVLGIAGLVGSGRSSLLGALAGDRHPSRGRLWVDEVEKPWPRTIRGAQRLGLALLPEDRAAFGLFGALSAADNILISDVGRTARGGVVSAGRGSELATAAARRVGFDSRRLRGPARNLSGGNQQKLLLARWAHSPPSVLLADEPTRGVDVGARAEIGATLRDLAAQEMSVIVASSELEELEVLCDRAIVLANGRIVGELSGADLTVEKMLAIVFASERGE